MNHMDLAAQVETKARKGEAGNSQDKAKLNKFLSGANLKSSFHFSFESMFLDMFAPAKTVEAPRVKEVKAESVKVEEPRRVEDAKAGFTPLPRIEDNQAEAAEAPQTEQAEAASEQGDRVEADEKAGDECCCAHGEAKAEEKSDAEKSERAEAPVVEVRMIQIELEGAFRKALSDADLGKLVKKIENLLEDDSLSIEELMAGAVGVIEDILGKLGPVQVEVKQIEFDVKSEAISKDAMDILAAGDEADGARRRDFLRKLLARIKGMLEDAGKSDEGVKAESKERGEGVAEASTDRKVDEAILKLMKKVDRPERIEIDPRRLEQEKPVDRPAEIQFDGAREAAERRASQKSGRENVENKVRELAGVDKGEGVARAQDERAARFAAAEAALAPVRNRGNGAEVRNHGQAVKGIAEAAPAARGGEAGNQTSWQNAYDNASARRNNDVARSQEAKNGAPARQTPQAQVFEQIVQHAKFVVTDGKGEATLKLKPEFLGNVEMKVTVEDKKAQVKIVVENSAVRTIINENAAELRRNLQEMGIEVELMEVVLSGGTGEKQGGEGEAYEGGEGGSGDGYELEDEIGVEESRRITLDEVDGSTVRYVA